MMSSAFSPSSYLSFSLSHREDRSVSVSGSVPFLLYPSSMDPYKDPLRGPGPGLLPYLAPFHHHGHFSVYECPFEPAFIQKRNERERQRVRCVNQGYAKLRDHLPGQSADKRLSKVETLRAAIRYIKYLQGLVELEDGRHGGGESPDTSSPGADCGGESEGVTC
ncbi:achaete-scute homolog 5-like [Siniperca chuatsi]|uniref:achaete-scute homolog 5-like n=1 Tax=Siniperca chuatsi TaxID=119488 RepID=UPI001CE1E971|nr:achaete-scute homolog 5-like [Siniperca chuatsi]